MLGLIFDRDLLFLEDAMQLVLEELPQVRNGHDTCRWDEPLGMAAMAS